VTELLRKFLAKHKASRQKTKKERPLAYNKSSLLNHYALTSPLIYTWGTSLLKDDKETTRHS